MASDFVIRSGRGFDTAYSDFKIVYGDVPVEIKNKLSKDIIVKVINIHKKMFEAHPLSWADF